MGFIVGRIITKNILFELEDDVNYNKIEMKASNFMHRMMATVL